MVSPPRSESTFVQNASTEYEAEIRRRSTNHPRTQAAHLQGVGAGGLEMG